MKRKYIFFILFSILLPVLQSVSLQAAVQEEEVVVPAEELDEKSRLAAQLILDNMGLDAVQKELDDLLEGYSFSLQEILQQLMQGEQPFTWEQAENVIEQIVVSQFVMQKEVMIQSMLLVIVSALLTNFSSIFKNGQIGEVAFYMIYMLLLTLLIRSFGAVSEDISVQLGHMSELMRILTPAYFFAVLAASGGGTATVFYEMVLILVYVIGIIMQGVILPGIHLYVLLELINYIQKEDFLSKMADLIRTIIDWALKSCTGIFVGWQVIQSMIAPALDSLKRTFLGKTAGVIPGIGDLMDGAAQVAVGTAVLVRNCFGAAAMVICILLFLAPAVRVGIITLLYKFLAAVAQPAADARMVGCFTTVANGYVLLLRVLITIEILSVLTIAILATSFFH